MSAPVVPVASIHTGENFDEGGSGRRPLSKRKNKGEFMTRILLLGLDPETVDYSDPSLPPGMTAEKIRAGVAVALKQFTERGWESDVGYIRAGRKRRAGGGTSVTFGELRLCGNRSRRAPAAPASCIIRSRHQRYS